MKKLNKVIFRTAITALLLTAITPSPAYAHPYIAPNAVALNKTVSLLFTVYAEGNTDMKGVEVDLPTQFAVKSISPPENWKVTKNTNPIELSGTPLELGTVAVFTITGVPSQLGNLPILVTTIAVDGTRVVWDGTNLHTQPKVTVVKHVVKPGKPIPIWVYFIPSFLLIAAIGGVFVFLSWRDRQPTKGK